jgi:hypothetical protein
MATLEFYNFPNTIPFEIRQINTILQFVDLGQIFVVAV